MDPLVNTSTEGLSFNSYTHNNHVSRIKQEPEDFKFKMSQKLTWKGNNCERSTNCSEKVFFRKVEHQKFTSMSTQGLL